MKMNRSTDYAVRVLILLASSNSCVASKEICRHVKISQRYLFKITAKLRDANLLIVISGPKGGYRLSRPADEISLSDILVAMEGPIQGPKQAKQDSIALDVVYTFSCEFLTRYLTIINLKLLAKAPEADWLKVSIEFLADTKTKLLL